MKIDHLIVKPDFGLTAVQCQALMEFELMLASIGLELYMQCIKCHPRFNPEGDLVAGDARKDGSVYTFTTECRCSKHVYRGDELIFPVAPSFTPIDADEEGSTRLQPLTREQMAKFSEADQLFRVLKMRHWFRCMNCRHQGRPTDGVWGVGDSTASEFIVQCACTKRVYSGADAAMPVH